MRVMVMVRATESTEAGKLPDEKLIADMQAYNEELIAAGIMEAGDGLKPSSRGARIRFSPDDRRTVVDGPFAETKELIAGFWMWKVKSMEEAIAWAKRAPSPVPGEACEIELRPVYEPEDFGPAYTEDLRQRDQRLQQLLKA